MTDDQLREMVALQVQPVHHWVHDEACLALLRQVRDQVTAEKDKWYNEARRLLHESAEKSDCIRKLENEKAETEQRVRREDADMLYEARWIIQQALPVLVSDYNKRAMKWLDKHWQREELRRASERLGCE